MVVNTSVVARHRRRVMMQLDGMRLGDSKGIRYRVSTGLKIEEPFAYSRHWSSYLDDLATVSQPTTTLLVHTERPIRATYRDKMTLQQHY